MGMSMGMGIKVRGKGTGGGGKWVDEWNMHMPFDKLGQHRGRSYREKRRGFLGTRMVSDVF